MYQISTEISGELVLPNFEAWTMAAILGMPVDLAEAANTLRNTGACPEEHLPALAAYYDAAAKMPLATPGSPAEVNDALIEDLRAYLKSPPSLADVKASIAQAASATSFREFGRTRGGRAAPGHVITFVAAPKRFRRPHLPAGDICVVLHTKSNTLDVYKTRKHVVDVALFLSALKAGTWIGSESHARLAGTPSIGLVQKVMSAFAAVLPRDDDKAI